MSYKLALGAMIGLITVVFPFGMFGLKADLGRVKKENVTLKNAFTQNRNMNYLSLSRVFLFGSRDLWFEIPLPFFLRSESGMGWSRSAVGAVLAGYIILYGQLQTYTPQLFLDPLKQSPPNKHVAVFWNAMLIACPLFFGICLTSNLFDNKSSEGRDETAQVILLIFGIVFFALLFAINSAIHSYLVLKYAGGNKLSMSVGYYYMANAVGRLLGTILSGAIYTAFGEDDVATGFAMCFWASCVSVGLSTFFETFLCDDDGGLVCGSIKIIKHTPTKDENEEVDS